MAESADNPGVIAPPPLIYAAAFLIALLLHRLALMTIFGGGLALWPGLALVALSVGLAIWGRQALVSAGTNVNPYRPRTAIGAPGPYAVKLHPPYVGLA